MTNAICPEHSACVNPRRVPAGPHPTLRPLYPPPLTLSASTGRVDQSRRSSGLRRRRSERTNSGIYARFCVCNMRSQRAETSTSSHKIMLHLLVFQRRWSAEVYENHQSHKLEALWTDQYNIKVCQFIPFSTVYIPPSSVTRRHYLPPTSTNLISPRRGLRIDDWKTPACLRLSCFRDFWAVPAFRLNKALPRPSLNPEPKPGDRSAAIMRLKHELS